ncbi:hypothetical protein GCM10009850_086500 [Nonomuraea monospora]|uniref:Uncharacterized protein n=1 Tax=Nonomuraea monospora TaxID=568818 RepID=A0ABN3CUT8_9ACTN
MSRWSWAWAAGAERVGGSSVGEAAPEGDAGARTRRVMVVAAAARAGHDRKVNMAHVYSGDYVKQSKTRSACHLE